MKTQGNLVLVTGGTGFFGHNLVKALLETDNVGDIRVYSRHDPPTELELSRYDHQGRNLLGPGVEPCPEAERVTQAISPTGIFLDQRVTWLKGDICDAVSLRDAMEGCDVVFHACGDTRWWGAIDEQQRLTNVDGTSCLFAYRCRRIF